MSALSIKNIVEHAMALKPKGVSASDVRRAAERAITQHRRLYLETSYAGGPGRCYIPSTPGEEAECEKLVRTSTRWYRLL